MWISLKDSKLRIFKTLMLNFNTIDAINASNSNLDIDSTIIGFSKSDMIDVDFGT